MWTPVVDVSQYQGRIDFATMRRAGVAGVIIRATHGLTEDTRLVEHVARARAGGYRDRDLGFYTFLNPKRGSAAACARATVDAIERALGHLDTFYMLDVEDYRPFTPNPGAVSLFGPAYVAWLRTHIAEVRKRAPDVRLIGYGNGAFWDGPLTLEPGAPIWVGDQQLAAELDWIAARYPVFPDPEVREDPVRLAEFIRTSPKPPAPPGWDEWAFAQDPAGPVPPAGGRWQGWQFSADYNRQGPTYGASSADLDVNIVRTTAWERWTRPATVGDATITVRSGDGWIRLARRGLGDGSRWRELAALNGGAARVLQPGDVIRLPGAGGGSGGGSGGTGGTVMVRPGDSWYRIAERELGSGPLWPQIAALNGGPGRMLHPGDVIRLPAVGGGSGGGSGGSGGGSGGSGGGSGGSGGGSVAGWVGWRSHRHRSPG